MYRKTQDRGDYVHRVASHATKAAANGMVPWAKDEYDPVAERKRLSENKRLLRKKLYEMREVFAKTIGDERRQIGLAMHQINLKIDTIRAELRKLPKPPCKPLGLVILEKALTVPVWTPEHAQRISSKGKTPVSVHKLRRLDRQGRLRYF